MSAVGLAAGWAGTLVLPRLIASRLWGVGPSESAMTVVLITIVAATAATAAWVPLRRALRVDPAITLRAE
jgi:ABC-type antimicrobial peptide transport system permease subunit